MAGGKRRRLKANTLFQKPGNSVKPPKEEDTSSKLGPIVVGFFIFVVVGSILVEIVKAFGGDKGSIAPEKPMMFQTNQFDGSGAEEINLD